MSFDERAKRAARAIISVFETGSPSGDYSKAVVLSDGAGISYGRHQSTHRSGSLGLVVKRFTETHSKDADVIRFQAILNEYLPLLEKHDNASIAKASGDGRLKNTLRVAGQTQEMQDAQDHVFDSHYMEPAIHACTSRGFTEPLSLAIAYDGHIQGGFDHVAGMVGRTLSEHDWMTSYVTKRRAWLLSSKKPIVRGTIYRPDSFMQIIRQGNWQLHPPFVAHGRTIRASDIRVEQAAAEPVAHEEPDVVERPIVEGDPVDSPELDHAPSAEPEERPTTSAPATDASFIDRRAPETKTVTEVQPNLTGRIKRLWTAIGLSITGVVAIVKQYAADAFGWAKDNPDLVKWVIVLCLVGVIIFLIGQFGMDALRLILAHKQTNKLVDVAADRTKHDVELEPPTIGAGEEH